MARRRPPSAHGVRPDHATVRELPHEVAARLMRGGGAAVITALAADDHPRTTATMHAPGPDGSLLLLIGPGADCGCGQEGADSGACPIAVCLLEEAPLPEVRMVRSAACVRGSVRCVTPAEVGLDPRSPIAAVLAQVLGAKLLRVEVAAVSVHCAGGCTPVSLAALAAADVDLVSARVDEVVEHLDVAWSHLWPPLVAGRCRRPLEVGTDIHLVGADRGGLDFVAIDVAGDAAPVRVPFARRAEGVEHAYALTAELLAGLSG